MTNLKQFQILSASSSWTPTSQLTNTLKFYATYLTVTCTSTNMFINNKYFTMKIFCVQINWYESILLAIFASFHVLEEPRLSYNHVYITSLNCPTTKSFTLMLSVKCHSRSKSSICLAKASSSLDMIGINQHSADTWLPQYTQMILSQDMKDMPGVTQGDLLCYVIKSC